jgi:hypothetical protein
VKLSGWRERNNMNLAMMQPAFMPWQGFFELIYKSEIFIFLDDFQFSSQSFQHRNRFFVNNGQVGWYTVPVLKSFKKPLSQTSIKETIPWREKMWRRIQQNYSKAKYFEEISPSIMTWLFSKVSSLSDLNIGFIKMVCGLLGYDRDFKLSSQLPSDSNRSERVIELLKWSNASRYYCAHGSFGYMQEDGVFPMNSIEILFQNFKPKNYPQVGSPGDFIQNLSVVDALLNIGPGKTAELIGFGTGTWLTWDEMCCTQ